MGRKRTSPFLVYESGPVRVLQYPSKGGYRILWSEGKRQRERSATNLAGAKEIAEEEAARLMATTVGVDGPATPVAVLLSAATSADRHAWGDDWGYNVGRYTAKHLVGQVGSLRCDQLTREVIQQRLAGMASDGYSHEMIKKVLNIVKMTVDLGVERGIWTPGNAPVTGVKVPRDAPGSEDGRPDHELIPTEEQVSVLRDVAHEWDPQWGTMVTVAAFTGVRWAELLGLTTDKIDLANRSVRIDRVCAENNKGRFEYRKPAKGRTRAKKPAAIRDIALAPEAHEALEKYLAGLPEWDDSKYVATDHTLPPNRLFARPDGTPHRRTEQSRNFQTFTADVTKLMRVAAGKKADAEGSAGEWPVGSTWHYLRHFCISRWINHDSIRMEIATASRMAGHTKVSTTFDWYVNADALAVDRAKERLWAADKGAS